MWARATRPTRCLSSSAPSTPGILGSQPPGLFWTRPTCVWPRSNPAVRETRPRGCSFKRRPGPAADCRLLSDPDRRGSDRRRPTERLAGGVRRGARRTRSCRVTGRARARSGLGAVRSTSRGLRQRAPWARILLSRRRRRSGRATARPRCGCRRSSAPARPSRRRANRRKRNRAQIAAVLRRGSCGRVPASLRWRLHRVGAPVDGLPSGRRFGERQLGSRSQTSRLGAFLCGSRSTARLRSADAEARGWPAHASRPRTSAVPAALVPRRRTRCGARVARSSGVSPSRGSARG